MSFGNAVRSGFANYVNFNGRASRSEYWWWTLFNFLVGLVALVLDAMLRPGGVDPRSSYGIISGLVSLALFLPSLAVLVRRLHDTDRSGWWFLIVFIPIIGAIVLIVFLASAGTPGPNRYGPPPFGTAMTPRYDRPPA